MFEFLKVILSELKNLFINSDNSKENKYKKIIYILILICALLFVGVLIFYVIKALPSFLENIQENYNNSQEIIDKNINLNLN